MIMLFSFFFLIAVIITFPGNAFGSLDDNFMLKKLDATFETISKKKRKKVKDNRFHWSDEYSNYSFGNIEIKIVTDQNSREKKIESKIIQPFQGCTVTYRTISM